MRPSSGFSFHYLRSTYRSFLTSFTREATVFLVFCLGFFSILSEALLLPLSSSILASIFTSLFSNPANIFSNLCFTSSNSVHLLALTSSSLKILVLKTSTSLISFSSSLILSSSDKDIPGWTLSCSRLKMNYWSSSSPWGSVWVSSVGEARCMAKYPSYLIGVADRVGDRWV